MKLKESKIYRLIAQPLLFAILICLPWWLLAEFLVKTELASSSYAIVIFVVMWLTMLASAIIREKPEKDRERITSNIITVYFGKVMPIYIGIAFLLVLLLLIMSLINR
jgi:hypothetical protein